ncbi:retrotransposon protein, putative, ty1-copia subclass [Tanacetum coccineum]
MHSMGKTIVELHAMLKLHEKGIPKKAETPIVLAIQEGKIQKDKRKPRGVKGKDKGKNKLAYAPKPKISSPPKRDTPTKDSICHHCKEGLRRSKKLKHRALSLYMGNGIRAAVEEIDMHNLYPNVSSTLNVSNKRVKYSLDSSYPWHCCLGHINKKHIDKLQRDGILQSTHDESLEKCKSCIIGKMACKPFPHQVEKAKDLLGLIHTDGYALESTARILNMVPTKKVERMPYEIWHGKDPKLSYLKETMGYYFYYPPENKIFVAQNAKFFENSLIVKEASGSHGLLKMSRSNEGLELIQEEDTQHSKNTSEEHNEVMPIEEHELGDLNEPPNYKATLSDTEYDKWLEAMNTEIQSMKDNQVWILVKLPSNG